MAPHPQDHSFSAVNPAITAVAIDKDKHSSSAVKWSIEHLMHSNPCIILIHVRVRSSQPQSFAGMGESRGALTDVEVQQLFKASRVYCARKGIRVKEVVLEDSDISRAIVEYISENRVKNMVLGASSRNALSRKFWTHDVPTIVNKAAPEFCSVYVIAREKTQSYRPAANYSNTNITPRHRSPQNHSSLRLKQPEPEDASRNRELSKGVGSAKIWPKSAISNDTMDSLNLDISFVTPSNSTTRNHHYGDTDFSGPSNFGSMDFMSRNLYGPDAPGSIGSVSNVKSSNEISTASYTLEAEMNKIKLELKQTMEMYNSACKEAVIAQQKVREFDQRNSEGTQRIEHSRQSEEAAMQLVEIEQAKCKAAIEAAQKSQRLAELEATRRKLAEDKAKHEEEQKDKALKDLSQNDVRYRKYSIEEIETATSKFAQESKIGEGGYGPVYKGKLDHTPVAIKILRSDAAQGMKQFQQEIEVLSCIRHPNMVLLLGACPEYGCLVYEFMNYGSLEDRLFRKGNSPPIPWPIRFRIAADIATGLLFLHQAKPEPLVHRDLKPANILLDHNYVCKIADVGLARLVPPSIADTVTQYHMTSAAGTFCYIDPEYQHTGKLGTKSDIYSLGVMLLQILTARPPMGLTHHVEKAIKKGTFGDLLDPTVPGWPVEEALGLAKLAMQCAELRKKDRPSLDAVILPELNRLKELGMMDHIL